MEIRLRHGVETRRAQIGRSTAGGIVMFIIALLAAALGADVGVTRYWLAKRVA